MFPSKQARLKRWEVVRKRACFTTALGMEPRTGG